MIRTAPVAAPRVRAKALIAGSLIAVLMPFIVGLPVWLIDRTGEPTVAGFIGTMLIFSPTLSLPLAPIGSLLANRALRTGHAGPMIAAVAGIGLGVVVGLGFIILTFNMLLEGGRVIAEILLTCGGAGAIWGLLYWAGVWACIPDAIRPRAAA